MKPILVENGGCRRRVVKPERWGGKCVQNSPLESMWHGRRGWKYVEGAITLFKSNFVESASTQEPLYVALRNGKHYYCLQCLVSEKIEVEFETKSDLLQHIEVAHPHLFDYLSEHPFRPISQQEREEPPLTKRTRVSPSLY